MLPLFPPKELGGGLLGPNPVYSRGEGTPWMSCQLIAGPLLMAAAATQGANCTSAASLGSFSVLLKDILTHSSIPPGFPVFLCFQCVGFLFFGAGIRTSDLSITSPPALPTELVAPEF